MEDSWRQPYCAQRLHWSICIVKRTHKKLSIKLTDGQKLVVKTYIIVN